MGARTFAVVCVEWCLAVTSRLGLRRGLCPDDYGDHPRGGGYIVPLAPVGGAVYRESTAESSARPI